LDSFVVVGPGAMGILFAHALHRAGRRTLLFDHRPERAAFLNRRGIRVRIQGRTRTARVPVVTPCEVAGAPGVSLVLFCVKAYATAAAAALVQALVGERALVATLQNGIGNAETLAEAFGAERVLVGTTSEGATLMAQGVVVHAGSGTTHVGSMTEARSTDALRLCEVLRGAGFRAEYVADWESAVWTKAVINASINPLTALLHVPNGRLAEWESTRSVVEVLAEEGRQIARARGIAVPDGVAQQAVEVCRATANNRSSMLQDVEQGRRTELEYLNGVLLREAERLGVPVPAMRVVTELARAREQAPGA
jgi:2-dehydropantoate 2-reductase